jgi:hypothetical protein
MTRLFLPLSMLLLVSCGASDNAAEVCEKDYQAKKQQEITVIEEGIAVYRYLAETNATDDDVTDEQRRALEAMSVILEDRSRPVDDADLAIINEAQLMLSSPEVWNRADTRECPDDAQTFSLYCALHDASEKVLGVYEHRRTVIQEARFVLEKASGGKEYDHRLMGYNNDPETTFEDIRAIMTATKVVIEDRLELQSKCLL